MAGLQEIRLRTGESVQIIADRRNVVLPMRAKAEDIHYCVNMATKYSPWAAESMKEGFISAPGGHRIGICGEAVSQSEQLRGVKNIRSICIRVAGDYPGIASKLRDVQGHILIIGSPGSGKTTLLRDLIRQLSEKENIGVVDQRGELFPACFRTGPRTDILTGCRKDMAIDMLLRTMSPDSIAMDEITKDSDCIALRKAAWCGVRLIATAHAADAEELHRRLLYKAMMRDGIFDTLIVLNKDKTWHTVRI
jgi:stage III sporulation protein AA